MAQENGLVAPRLAPGNILSFVAAEWASLARNKAESKMSKSKKEQEKAA